MEEKSVNNFDVGIYNENGEFFPMGEYEYIGHPDEKYIDFTKVDKMIQNKTC